MTLGGYMMSQFSLAQYGDFFLRILIACLCGAAIGLERSRRYKEAGLRTHVIVCCAAALMMIVSKYGFADLTDIAGKNYNGTRGADPARIAAQVVSGISFLGAGIIFHNKTSIRGLTTAAGIWATAGIGLAIGSGLVFVGVFGTIVVDVLQVVMHKFAINADLLIIGRVHCTVTYFEKFRSEIYDYFEKNKIKIISEKITFNDNGSSTFDFTLRLSPDVEVSNLIDMIASFDDVHEISCEIDK